MDIQYESPKAIKKGLDQNKVLLIDVRNPNEYEAEHIPGAVLQPLDTLSIPEIDDLRGDRALVFHCVSGKRAEKAMEKYLKESAHHKNIYCMQGSLNAWKKQGLKTDKGQEKISLERQVMGVAGFSVLTGVLLGTFVSSGFVWISGFVGAGLLFAGISGSCLLKRMLLKLPYNRT